MESMLPFAKTRNALAATLGVRRRRLAVKNTPTHIFLEVTNRCNLACVMCGRTHDKRHNDESFLGDISLQTVRKLEPLYGRSTFVTATGLGEPFLNPQMIPILDYLKSVGASVSLTTNGTILDESIVKALVDLEVDRVVCSIDSPEAETYQRIRVGARLEEVLRNIARLSAARARSPKRRPYLILEFVAMAQNFHQLPQIADLAGRLDFDEVIVQNLFKAFAPGYNNFYQQNKLAALEPDRVLEIWGEFQSRLKDHSIRLYSPFSDGEIHRYLRRGEQTAPRAMKPREGWMGYLDQPLPEAHLEDECRVSGWVLGVQGRPRAEICIENATQNLTKEISLDVLRPDVLGALPEEFPREPLCGFSAALDISEIEPGVATLSLHAKHHPEDRSVVLARQQVFVRSKEDYRMYCTQPWSTVFVSWEGRVRTCCFNEFVLGDLAGDSIEAIWNGREYQDLRQKVVDGEVIPECMDCLAGKSNPDYIRPLANWLRLPRPGGWRR